MISIVTICYNNPRELLRTGVSIQTLKRQYGNVEWIVIDGSMNEDIAQVAAQKKFDIDIFISEPDRGISHAWNKGIRLASGDHVMIVNSGDEVRAMSFPQIFSELEHGKILFTSTQILSADSVDSGIYRERPRLIPFGMFVPHIGAFVPRQMYESLGYYKELRHSMDYEWFYRNYNNLNFVVKNEIVSSVFYLGGVSSKEAVLGFWTDFKIQSQNSFLPFISFCVFLIKAAKHSVVNRLL